MANTAMAIWPQAWMQKHNQPLKYQGSPPYWTVEKPMNFHTIPEHLPAPERVMAEITVNDHDSVRLEIYVAPEASKMLHTLPTWFELYEHGGADAYHMNLIQSVVAEVEEAMVILSIEMVGKTATQVQMRATLEVEMSEHPDVCSLPEYIMVGKQSWNFVYDHATQTLQWETPVLQFPPPPETVVRTYQPAPLACLYTDYANGISVKHCDPPGCDMLDYQVMISTDDLSRLLLGR
jgi:hypothetical protein